MRHRKITSARKPEAIAAFEKEVFAWPVKDGDQDEPPVGDDPAEVAEEQVGGVEDDLFDSDTEEQGGRGDEPEVAGDEGKEGEDSGKASPAVTLSGRVTGMNCNNKNGMLSFPSNSFQAQMFSWILRQRL